MISQTYSDIEYIIIDGGSTDGSREYIEKQSEEIDYWLSEPDRGIYDAMNKGISKVRGQFCLFLNSGDHLVDQNCIEKIVEKGLTADVVGFDTIVGRQIWKAPTNVSYLFLTATALSHQSTLIKTDLFFKYGLYSTEYRIISDWVFFYKVLILNKCSWQHIDFVLTVFERPGISDNPELRERERWNEIKKHMHISFDQYRQLRREYWELDFYRKSWLVQFAKKIHNSSIYSTLRNLIRK